MHDDDSRLPWLQPAWRANADAWIAAQLAEQGVEQTAPVEQFRARPWSTVMRVPVTAGVLYFKEPVAVQGYEATLTAWLAGRHPSALPPVLVADTATHRLLLGDAGVKLGDVEDQAAYIDAWRRALADVATIQLASADEVDHLLALGVPDRRLAVLPVQYQSLLDHEEPTLRAGQDGLTPKEVASLRALESDLGERCVRLADIGVPETIQHNDLHDSNIFVRAGDVVLADWADACVSHPFTMVGEMFGTIVRRRAIDAHGPVLAALRQSYLRRFTRFADADALERAARLAAPLGLLCGILTAHQIARGVDPEVRDSMMQFQVEWLRRFASGMREPVG